MRSQLKFTEEEARVMRRQLRQAAAGLTPADQDNHDDDDDDEPAPRRTAAASDTSTTSTSAHKDTDKETSELRMQLDSAEYEVYL